MVTFAVTSTPATEAAGPILAPLLQCISCAIVYCCMQLLATWRFDIYIQRNNFQNIHEITIKTSHLIIYFHTLLYSRKSESIINLHSLECVFGKLVLNNYLKAILGFKAAKALPILCININATIFCFSDTYSQCSGLYA